MAVFLRIKAIVVDRKNPVLDEVFDDKTVEREGFEPSILLNTVYPLSR